MGFLKKEKGTATVEMAVMMPVFVMLIIVMVYLGAKQVMDIRALKEVNLISQQPGVQDERDLPDDFLELPSGAKGYVDQDVVVQDLEIPSDYDEEFFKEILVEDMFNVTGGYELQGDTFVYTTSVTKTATGELSQKFGLVDTVGVVAEEFDRAVIRTDSSIYVDLIMPFSVFDEDTEGHAFESGGMINVNRNTRFELLHKHSHVIVGEMPPHQDELNESNYASRKLLPIDKYPNLPEFESAWSSEWDSESVVKPDP